MITAADGRLLEADNPANNRVFFSMALNGVSEIGQPPRYRIVTLFTKKTAGSGQLRQG
ncbi:MAG: hypothetical protein H7Y43_07955 [Akkermansiaceae bacterium]|nr:hypothetical protein [Verrucomicrobiales bacterium]